MQEIDISMYHTARQHAEEMLYVWSQAVHCQQLSQQPETLQREETACLSCVHSVAGPRRKGKFLRHATHINCANITTSSSFAICTGCLRRHDPVWSPA